MNSRDQLELEVLEATGDVELAAHAGAFAYDFIVGFASAMLGIPSEEVAEELKVQWELEQEE